MRPMLISVTAFAILVSHMHARPVPQQIVPETGQAPTRNPQAVALFQLAVAAMGGVVPSDVTATGTVTTVAGSLNETGTVVILARGTNQTSEQIQTPSGFTIVYSRGLAATIKDGSLSRASLDMSATAQSAFYPLPLLVATLNNPDVSYAYVGLEPLNGAQAQHLQFWNTYASIPELQNLARSSQRDVWIDSVTGLPRKISHARRSAGGAGPGTRIEVLWSNYRNMNGVVYPCTIQVSINGTPWADITIQTVASNTGLTDAAFPVQ